MYVFTNAFRRLSMVHHAHKLSYTTLEEETCELLFLELLFISDNTGCFSLNIKEISFLLALQILEAEQKLEIQAKSSTNLRTNINNSTFDCKYNPFKGIILVHYHDRIYVPKTVRKLFF